MERRFAGDMIYVGINIVNCGTDNSREISFHLRIFILIDNRVFRVKIVCVLDDNNL